MKKIGLVTLFRDNYGSELQCFATKTFVVRLGYQCDVLFNQALGTEKVFMKLLNTVKILGYSVVYRGFWKNRKEVNKSNRVSINRCTPESQFGLDWFRDSVLQPKGIGYSMLSDKRFKDEYDYFIAGSDQIWNGSYLVSPFMFLEFAEDSKKIALCPSMSVEHLKSFNIKQFKKSISKYKCLSAREESGVQIIKELTGRTVPRLADPVMLLSVEDWEKFSELGAKIFDKYIFLHFLGKPTELAVDSIKLLSDDYKVVCFANPYDELKCINGLSVVSGSPYDYVSIIRNAEYVFTDSFHTSYFSIIFDRNFFTFDRDYGHSNKQSTRIKTLISTYKCSERFITTDNSHVLQLLNVYPDFRNIRESEHQAISEYLRRAITEVKPVEQLKASAECTGCMTCLSICPQGAVSASYSKFGYRIPEIDSNKCINCGLCTKVCDFQLLPASVLQVKAYIAYNLEKNLMLKSASGGVFSALAKAFIERGGTIVASKFTFENGKPIVAHAIIDKIDDLSSVLGSKYVESDCSTVYQPISKILKQNGRILFCGTSCQVKALYSYLDCKNISRDNLFTIDLICHGVPGIQLFSDYIKHLSEKYNGKFTDFQFREKGNGDIKYQISGILISGNRKFHVEIPISRSSYYDMFIRQENYREQCYHCEYASIDKPADITIGDYFEAKKDYPSLFTDNGELHDAEYLNCLLVRSEKGKRLLDEFGEKLFLYPVEHRRVQLSHSNLCKPSSFTHVRLDAMDAYDKNGFDGIERMYKKIFLIRKLQVAVRGFAKKIKRKG